MSCKPVAVMEDGWSEWIHPSPGFRMECCDCGLVHELHVRIGKDNGEGTPLNEGERRNGRAVIFRMRRATESNTQSALGDLEEANQVVSQYVRDSDTQLDLKTSTMARSIALIAIKRSRRATTTARNASQNGEGS